MKEKKLLTKGGITKQFALIIFFFIPFFVILSSQKMSTKKQTATEKTARAADTYNIFSTIPGKENNIFKDEKLSAIIKLRESYLLNTKNSSVDVMFEYEELDEACRQAFGAYSPVHRSLIVRGIMTANGVRKQSEIFLHQYRLFTPIELGLEETDDLNSLQNYENLPEFDSIVKSGVESFPLKKRIELYKLRDYYFNDKAYLSSSVGFEYRELDRLVKQVYNTSSPYLQALIKRGILTAHRQYKDTDSTQTINYRPGTPKEMGFRFGGLINEKKK